MTTKEFIEKTLRDDTLRILKSPEEAERWLGVIDYTLGIYPGLREHAANCLAEAAPRCGGSPLGSQLKAASEAVRAGRNASKAPYVHPSDRPKPSPKPKPPLEELKGIEVGEDEYARVMKARKAELDPNAESRGVSGYSCDFTPDGRVAGWIAYDSWRGEYKYSCFVVEPWQD